MCQIKNIYAGKPDAKDEVTFDGIQRFVEAFIIPENLDVQGLITGDKMFITGYKGTGKTALLYYLDSLLKNNVGEYFSSFIFFKGDFSDTKLQEFEELSKKLFSYITIDPSVAQEGNDFCYIWRWLFYQRIIEDNRSVNFQLFENNKAWKDFESNIANISFAKKKRWLSIPEKIKLSCPVSTPDGSISVAPDIELNFHDSEAFKTDAYKKFSEIIDCADEKFQKLTRTNYAYYIFIDELEAYFGDDNIFRRDLKIIRDLIFTVKALNTCFHEHFSTKTKIICSVRTEILNAIYRFVIPKELNKVITGYQVALIWDYTNTNSFSHPILKILTKRIKLAEAKNLSEKELIAKWFSPQINGIDTPHYILDNGWHKPRDIVRMILTAQNSICASSSMFDQATFDTIQKKYSLDSLIEIKEELRALYSSEEIENIVLLFTGFRIRFSFSELLTRIDQYFSETFIKSNVRRILHDLYRIGFIGNCAQEAFRWQHRGDDGLIISDDWDFRVHNALIQALTLNIHRGTKRAPSFDVVVMKKQNDKLIVRYCTNGTEQWGHIKISSTSRYYKEITEGKTIRAVHVSYDEHQGVNILRICSAEHTMTE